MWLRSLFSWTGSSAASAMLDMMIITMMNVSKNGKVTIPWMKIRTLRKCVRSHFPDFGHSFSSCITYGFDEERMNIEE